MEEQRVFGTASFEIADVHYIIMMYSRNYVLYAIPRFSLYIALTDNVLTIEIVGTYHVAQ